MDTTSQNVFVKPGMVENHPLTVSTETSVYNLNAELESITGDSPFLSNVQSNVLATRLVAGYMVIGRKVVIEQGRVIYMLVNPTTGQSEIGETLQCEFIEELDVDREGCVNCGAWKDERTPLELTTQEPYCPYFTIKNQNCFNFNINYPVDIEYEITDCGLNIYFTDDLNQRRYLYFDYNGQRLEIQEQFYEILRYEDGDCKVPVYGTNIDCNKIVYHPNYDRPCIDFVDLANGGSNKAGVYQFLVAYTDEDSNPLENYSPATQPIDIKTKNITVETNYDTNKSIVIDIYGLDTTFSYYNLVVAETIDNFTEFKFIGTFPINTTSKVRYTYTGNEEALIKLTANDVFFRRPFYEKAKTVTKSNDYLFYSGLTKFKKPSLQRIASKIKFNWEAVAIPEAVYNNPRNIFNYRTYQRDEVYPLGLVIEWDWGEEQLIHIPGREATQFDLDVFYNNPDIIEDINCSGITLRQRWQIYNTGSVTATYTNTVGDCNDYIPPQIGSKVNGTVAISCNDENCTEQGSITITFNFNTATTESIILHIGMLFRVASGGAVFGQGFSIFTPPAGTQPASTVDGQATWDLTVPAGTTTISHTFNDFSFDWYCQSCAFPTTNLYIKPESTSGLVTEFVTVQNYTVTNIVPTNAPPVYIPPNSGTCIDGCEDAVPYAWGEFAYWESTEKYPNDPDVWGDLCGKPIRHHKFPDSNVLHIHNGLNDDKQYSDNNIVYPIGIKIDHNTVIYALDWAVQQGIITQDERSHIKGYRIVRGNRASNKSIIAKGLLFDVWQYSKSNNAYYYANYPYNDLSPDNFISNNKDTYQGSNTSNPIPINFQKSNRYTFHSPDTSFSNPGLGSILKLETEEYGTSEGYFTEAEGQAKHKLLSTFSMSVAFLAGVAKAFAVEREEYTVSVTKTLYGNSTLSTFPGGADGAPRPVGVGLHFKGEVGNIVFDSDGALYGSNRLPNRDTGSQVTASVAPLGLGGRLVDNAGHTEYTSKANTPYQLLNPASLISTGNPILFTLGILAGFTQVSYLIIRAFQETDIYRQLIETLIPYRNYHVQYNSVGKYNNYKNVPNYVGIKQRNITKAAYVDPINQFVNEITNAATSLNTTVRINNWNRESTVYVKVPNTSPLPNPSTTDNSRVQLDTFGFKAGRGDLGTRVYRTISSYYASMKDWVPDQYGSIYNIEYLETNGCDFDLSKLEPNETGTLSRVPTNLHPVVFGGDTFINRFAFKKKVPFFLHTTFGLLNDADIKYSELGNVGYPNYYFDTQEPFGERVNDISFSIGDIVSISKWKNLYERIIGVEKSRMDGKTNKLFYQNGYIHAFNYGIPYFLVESDYNVDYRHAENNTDKDFYPNQTDLDFWLSEKNVPIQRDNTYIYNTSYSKQNKESVIINSKLAQTGEDEDCEVRLPNRLIYSDAGNWLIFKQNDKYDFPLSDGRLISADGIENDKVLVRSENISRIFNAYDTLQSSAGTIQVGTGGIFKSRPQEFAKTDLGYIGTQHKALLSTEFGHIVIDAKRGQIFNIANGGAAAEEISKYGKKIWFKNNLPFHLAKAFPNITLDDLDNNYKGIGLHMSFDKARNRLFVTKLDYKRLNNNVKYDAVNKEFYIRNGHARIGVSLTDTKYFCNASWTISYNFYSKTWISYHSFKPNFYNDFVDYIQSGNQDEKECRIQSHGLIKSSYQVYDGVLYPFIVEYYSKPDINSNFLRNISFGLDVVRYHGLDIFYNRTITFNKAVISNNYQCSGLLEMFPKQESNLYDQKKYPVQLGNKTQIQITNKENIWNFNTIKDVVNSQVSNIPFWINTCSQDNKILNQIALNYYKPELDKALIRGRQTTVRLINDKYSNYRMTFLFSKEVQNNSVV